MAWQGIAQVPRQAWSRQAWREGPEVEAAHLGCGVASTMWVLLGSVAGFLSLGSARGSVWVLSLGSLGCRFGV